MEMEWSEVFASMTPLQWWWVVQIILVGSSLLSLVAQGLTLETKTDPPGPGEEEKEPRFYQVRKRAHTFYVVGLLWALWITWTVSKTYCGDKPADSRIKYILNTVATPKKEAVDITCLFLASSVFILHLFRRIYESITLSIFSRRQHLGPLDLFWGFSFYIAAGVALIADGPEFKQMSACLSVRNLSWYHGIGLGLFIWASMHHHKCLQIFAKLRRNRAGHIVSTAYKVPSGDWFDLVSCPHYFAEILVYISIGFLLGMRSVTWWWTVAYVFTNQLYLAYNTHMWYLGKFGQFQNNRKMLIPFIL